MTQDNVNNTEPATEPKICPILNSPCIEGKCALSREFKQSTGGILKTFSMCAFNATNLILSELNQKITAPPQKFIGKYPLTYSRKIK
jgi:hypothetical protein